MTEIYTISRERILDQLEKFITEQPTYIFVMDLIPTQKESIFDKYEKNDFLKIHTYSTYLDNIKSFGPTKNECEITKSVADAMQVFIFKAMNYNTMAKKTKKLIVTCEDGRSVSGAVALWAMDWLMDGDENAFNKLNPDITPNVPILNNLYLHPIL